MTTRESTTPPAVAVITTGYRYDDDDGTRRRHHVRIGQTPSTPPVFMPADDAAHATRLATIIRGALADAYTAGRADAGAAVRLAPTAAGVTEAWNGSAYHVEIVADVEANSAEEAQELTGCLLAGRSSPQGHDAHALTGPGSWAPNVKRVERYEIDADTGERTIVADPGNIVQVYPYDPPARAGSPRHASDAT